MSSAKVYTRKIKSGQSHLVFKLVNACESAFIKLWELKFVLLNINNLFKTT